MPSKTKKSASDLSGLPAIPKELVSLFVTGPMTGETINAAGLAFKKALVEAAMSAELSHHLGYEPGADKPDQATNHRNGSTAKTVLTGAGKIRIQTPRDRDGSFEPLLVPKHARRFTGFDDKVIALYARGLTVREIQAFLREAYDTEVSADFISTVTDGVLAEITAWQSRPLEPVYPVVFFDALRVKMRDEGTVRNKAVYLAIGVSPEGRKDVLGIWIEQTEGAKFWLRVMTEIKNRGVNDILIAIIDGLKGFPEAINSVFPETQIQTCIVHLIRNSLDFCSWKDRKPVAKELKTIYRAADAEAAAAALKEFDEGPWGQQFAAITALWRRHWAHVIPFFAYPQEVRKMIYTTNSIESLNAKLRRSVRIRGHFPNDEAAMKLIWLQLREITKNWKMPPREWGAAKAQFAVVFGDRFEVNR